MNRQPISIVDEIIKDLIKRGQNPITLDSIRECLEKHISNQNNVVEIKKTSNPYPGCKNCNETLEHGWNYCPDCGAKIKRL